MGGGGGGGEGHVQDTTVTTELSLLFFLRLQIFSILNFSIIYKCICNLCFTTILVKSLSEINLLRK